jgi:hypothetical protein
MNYIIHRDKDLQNSFIIFTQFFPYNKNITRFDSIMVYYTNISKINYAPNTSCRAYRHFAPRAPRA